MLVGRGALLSMEQLRSEAMPWLVKKYCLLHEFIVTCTSAARKGIHDTDDRTTVRD